MGSLPMKLATDTLTDPVGLTDVPVFFVLHDKQDTTASSKKQAYRQAVYCCCIIGLSFIKERAAVIAALKINLLKFIICLQQLSL